MLWQNYFNQIVEHFSYTCIYGKYTMNIPSLNKNESQKKKKKVTGKQSIEVNKLYFHKLKLSLQWLNQTKEQNFLNIAIFKWRLTFVWVWLVAFSATEGLQFRPRGIWKLHHSSDGKFGSFYWLGPLSEQIFFRVISFILAKYN